MTAELIPGGARRRCGLRRHQWVLVDQIGRVCTYQCPCGKSKTRIRDLDVRSAPGLPMADEQAPDQARHDQPAA